MSETTITVSGNVATELRHVVTDTNVHIVSFRLATTPSRFDRAKAAFVDGPTSYLTVSCFRFLAQNVAASLHKGDPVVVTGTLKVRDWEKDGRSGTVTEVDAVVVGHDLNRGVSEFRKVTRTRAVRPEEDEAVRQSLAAEAAETEPAEPAETEPGVDRRTGEILDPSRGREGVAA